MKNECPRCKEYEKFIAKTEEIHEKMRKILGIDVEDEK